MAALSDKISMSKHLTIHARIQIYCIVLLWFVTCGTLANAATYYVATTGNDSVACATATNVSTPKRTISNALNCVGAGDTVFIRAGTYGESIRSNDRTIPTGTSWSSPLTISAYPGETVTLNPTSCEIFGLGANVQYIIFKDLILDGTNQYKSSTVACYGISLHPDSHHLRFVNVEIKSSPWNGIQGGGSYHEFINMKVHDSGAYAQSAGYSPGINGAYLTTDNSVVDGGEWYNNQCYGIRFLDSDATKSADGNVVRNARIYRNGYSVAFNGASTCGAGGGGIVLGDRNNAAYNNLIYDNYWGLDTTNKPTSGMLAYNNTLYKNRYGINISAANGNAQIINNIVFQNSIGIANAGSGTTFSGNLCSASGVGCSLIGNPQFANPSSFDLRLQAGSPAIDGGIPLSMVQYDFSRAPRPQGSQYDIGAYEGTGTSAALQPPRNLQVR